MSTLAAARADNFYYPPEWTPDQGGLNKFRGSHGALGKRANKIDQGILVIRFELPFDSWCGGCERHISRGTRYNAEKKKAGKYFTTTIWEFSMKCASCDQIFIIQTDPENRDYKFVSGIRKKIEEYSAKAAGTERLDSEETTALLGSDPFYKIEHGDRDAKTVKARGPVLETLEELQASRFKDDYSANKLLRRALRTDKKTAAAELSEAKARGLPGPLLPISAADIAEAALVKFRTADPAAALAEKQREARLEIRSAAVLSATGSVSSEHRSAALAALSKAKAFGIDPRNFKLAVSPLKQKEVLLGGAVIGFGKKARTSGRDGSNAARKRLKIGAIVGKTGATAALPSHRVPISALAELSAIYGGDSGSVSEDA